MKPFHLTHYQYYYHIHRVQELSNSRKVVLKNIYIAVFCMFVQQKLECAEVGPIFYPAVQFFSWWSPLCSLIEQVGEQEKKTGIIG